MFFDAADDALDAAARRIPDILGRLGTVAAHQLIQFEFAVGGEESGAASRAAAAEDVLLEQDDFQPLLDVCYEYIDDILQNAPKETTPAGVTRADAIVGPTLEVFLHEVGHAVFDYLSVPVLGREEDAADQFAAYLLLQFAKDDARRLIVGVAYAYNMDASRPSTKANPFADEHGLPAQRFYNILCMGYGADSKLFADLVEKGHLPKERAEGCEGEYDQVVRAMTKLIGPYIDRARAKQVRAKRWLRFDVQ